MISLHCRAFFVRMTSSAVRLTWRIMASSFTHLPHRAVLSLNGPDTITLLERLVTHPTDDWDAGDTRYGALLTPQGKVIADFLAIRTSDGVLLDVAKDHIDELAKRLKLFRLRSKVDIEVLEDLIVIASLEEATDGTRPVSDVQHVFLDPRYPGGRLRGFANNENWASLCGDQPAEGSPSIEAYHTDRISNGIPEQGSDFAGAEVFPADINMDVLGGVALNKGCFVGQEVVSRMHRRGQIRKRTLCVELPANLDADPGTDILAPSPVGTLSSRLGGVALARVRVDRWIKAEAASAPATINETTVIIAKPDWLRAETEAKEGQ